MSDPELVEALGAVEVGEHVRVTLADGTTFEGQANPIDYVPGESLRVEVRPGGSVDRYEISARNDDGWTDLSVRHADPNDDRDGWASLGTVENVTAGE